MKRETVDIVEDLIAALKIVVPFKTITDNSDGTYTIESCNTGYLFPCYKFVLDGIDYTVLNEVGKEFVFNSKFTIKGNVIPTATQVLLDGLKYYHGTVIATKEELKRKELGSDKFPMAFLLEVLKDKFNNADDARIERVSPLRLFFLSETNENDWTTQEHYEFAIKPMRNLLDKFITYLDKSALIGKIESYEAINHAKFGVFVSEKGGHTKRIFNDKLSGVELLIDLPIRKSKDCDDCNTEEILECLPATITDSNGVSTFEVLSGGTGVCTPFAPINVSNSNNSFNVDTTIDLSLANITVTRPDGTTYVTPSMENVVCTPSVAKSGIAYLYQQNNQTTSYATYDAAWHLVNTPIPANPANPLYYAMLDVTAANPINTLVNLNQLGTLDRFTDELGTQVYANNYKIDHLYNLGWYEVASTGLDWVGNLNAANSLTYLGFSDWRVPNMNEVNSTYSFDGRYLVGGSAISRGSSNTRVGFPANYNLGYYIDMGANSSKTYTLNSFYFCRYHF